MLAGQRYTEERYEGVTTPPSQQRRDGNNESTKRRSAHFRAEQLARRWRSPLPRAGYPAFALMYEQAYASRHNQRHETGEEYVAPARPRWRCEPVAGDPE